MDKEEAKGAMRIAGIIRNQLKNHQIKKAISRGV